MIGWLRAIFAAVERVLGGQAEAERQAAADLSDLTSQLTSLSAAVEHLRVLIEDSDPSPAVVGAPTFTPTQGEHQ